MPARLNKQDWQIVNQALALLEAEVEDEDEYLPRALTRVRSLRSKVFEHLDGTRRDDDLLPRRK